ncbi:DUF6232 family protein [Actinophytocola sp.]|uniref:DUF6232 family protein n=1 Tax=Actinophytocola sp. TaxID=1872138 RepID=UPI00389B31BC
MSLSHESIDVRVSQRILWFGSEAYPLHNITRTNTLQLVPNRGAAIRSHVIYVLLWLFGASVVTGMAQNAFGVLVFLAVLAWVVYKTIKLVEFLKLTLYELVVETAAGSHRGLISNNSHVVHDLAIRITDAINNPLAEFQMRVENFNVGDHITMFGNQNVGKAVR